MKAKILIIDDSADFRAQVKEYLEMHDLDIETFEAGTAEMGVAKASCVRPDIVLMDIHLPHGNGLEAIKHIKEENPDCDVIVLTMLDAEAFRQAALGLISIVVDPSSVGLSVQKTSSVEGTDAENLLVRWLSEILYLYDGEDYLVGGIEILKMSPTGLSANLRGEFVDEQRHRLKMDVKAVTYHQLSVSQGPEGAVVRVFLDI